MCAVAVQSHSQLIYFYPNIGLACIWADAKQTTTGKTFSFTVLKDLQAQHNFS